MSKFVVVSEAPKEIGKDELVIQQPDFLEEISKNAKKAPKHGLTGINHLRDIMSSIAEKYDHSMNVFRFRMGNYEGLPFKNNDELSAIITKILKAEYPAIFDKWLEHMLAKRPSNTKLVYYVGAFSSTAPFFKAGIDHIEEKDVESYLSGKPKKIVGRPAITNEEAKRATE